MWSAAVRQVARGYPQAVPEKESIAKIVSDTQGMKNTPMHICAKTVFVGRPSTEVHELDLSTTSYLSFSHYCRKFFKLVYV
jgi:hypothetical protein